MLCCCKYYLECDFASCTLLDLPLLRPDDEAVHGRSVSAPAIPASSVSCTPWISKCLITAAEQWMNLTEIECSTVHLILTYYCILYVCISTFLHPLPFCSPLLLSPPHPSLPPLSPPSPLVSPLPPSLLSLHVAGHLIVVHSH